MEDTRGKSILILGAGQMQVPAIMAARELGLRSLVADGNSGAVGRSLADEFVAIDLRDEDGLLGLARQRREQGRLDAVFTAGTDFSATVALIAEACALPGIGREVALNASIKSRMRAVFARHGVPSPGFGAATGLESARAVARRLGFPLVLKPVDSMGARGCRRIDGLDDLDRGFTDAIGYSRSGEVILEEYIDGPEFSIDALVYKGQIMPCGIADRHIYFPPYFIEMGHTMPSAHSPLDIAKVVSAFEKGVRALGIDNGVAKGDIKLGSDGMAKVGEIAARLSGGYMSGWTYPYATGVKLTKAAIRLALDLDPGDISPSRAMVSAERAFISIPGTLHSVGGLDEARAQSGVKDVFIRVRAGDTLVFPHNNVEKCGNVISQAITREGASTVVAKAAAAVVLRLAQPDGATEDFLSLPPWGSPSSYPPSAFGDIPGAVRQEVQSMPMSCAAQSPGGVGIIPLKSLGQLATPDWQGREAAEVLDLVLREGHVGLGQGSYLLGRGFWLAFLRGGYQGALYVIDKARAMGQGT